MHKVKALLVSFLGLFGIAFGIAPAFAVGPDFSSITAGVDFSTVGPAILAIAALMGTVLVFRKGAKLILGMIK